jgi:hypothetical protein
MENPNITRLEIDHHIELANYTGPSGIHTLFDSQSDSSEYTGRQLVDPHSALYPGHQLYRLLWPYVEIE